MTGPAVETIKLEAEIDATDQLEFPDRNTAATQSGVLPAIYALESLLYPPSARLQADHALAGDVEAHLEAAAAARAFELLDLDVVDLRRLLDDALGEREAAGEILEVAGRGHHHGMADAVIDQRHRHLLGDDLVTHLGPGGG